jgi:hypothetical protein
MQNVKRLLGAVPMKLRGSWLLRVGLLAVFLLATFASPVLAKDDDEKPPPYDVDGLSRGDLWVPWVFAFVFAGGCLAIAFKNPRRSVTERD